MLGLLIVTLAVSAEAAPTLRANRAWDHLREPDAPRDKLIHAAPCLEGLPVFLAGAELNAEALHALGATPPEEPLLRAVRERLRRPVDLDDLLYFLDDVCAGRGAAAEVFVAAGRARNSGILLHPADIFESTPRVYAATPGPLAIDRPARPAELPPAQDGDVLGPNWSARYPNPEREDELLEVLRAARPDFAARVASLTEQLRAQGAEVYLTSTVRRRERGYLMWGAFVMSRQASAKGVSRAVRLLERRNEEWGLRIPIQWRHPGGWRQAVEAGRLMAEAYDVVFATERGARQSDHYEGVAVDFVAVGLPRQLVLAAPSGATATFDLSQPDEPRDISLTPGLIAWVEEHFGMRKLKSDYPHWTDGR